MFEGEGITEYLKKYLPNDALTLFSVRDSYVESKEIYASDILTNGISLTKDIPLRNILCPKGLVKNIKSLEETITNKTYYADKDICNVVISTPQVIDNGEFKYYIGYPRDNVSGYTTAEHQKNYDCFLTDYLEKIKKIFNNLVLGYYYEDSNGKKYFKYNEKHYSKLKDSEKEEFFNTLIEKVDSRISDRTDKKDILNYIKNSIESKKCEYNSKYLTALEYLEYSDYNYTDKVFDRDSFVRLLKDNYGDYSLYIHGVDQETPKASKDTCDHILRRALDTDWEYGMRGTVEPKGPIDENDILYKDLDYHYHGNSEEDYNIIVLIPKVLEDLDHNAYFIGYSRRNTTGSMPKVMKDFCCLASDIIDDIGYIPHEFIFGYQVFGSEVEEKFFINPYHISLLGDDLQRIACTKILRRNTENLKNNLEVFNLKNIDLDVIESYKNPLIKTDRKTSMQTTAEEFFDYLNNQNVIEDKPKSMIK